MKVYRVVQYGKFALLGEGNNLNLGYITPPEKGWESDVKGLNTFGDNICYTKCFFFDFLDAMKYCIELNKKDNNFVGFEVMAIDVPDDLLKRTIGIGLYEFRDTRYFAIEFAIYYPELYNVLSGSNFDENERTWDDRRTLGVKKYVNILKQSLHPDLKTYERDDVIYCFKYNGEIIVYNRESIIYSNARSLLEKCKNYTRNSKEINDILKAMGYGVIRYAQPFTKSPQNIDKDRIEDIFLALREKTMNLDIEQQLEGMQIK